MLPLKGVIAVNAAVFDAPKSEYFITMDYTFFKKTRARRKFFDNLACTKFFVAGLHHPYLVEFQGTFRDKRIARFVYDLSPVDVVLKSRRANGCGFAWKDFRSGENSGFSGLQLAVLLGYTEIYLLGMDLTCHKGTHYHYVYPQNQLRFERKLGRYLELFHQGLGDIKKHGGVEVFSCSEISALNDVIPFVPFAEVL